MQRTTFLRSLAAGTAFGALSCAPAAAAVDEVDIGAQTFAQLREDGDILFDSVYYEHLNEVGSVIADTVKARYDYPIRYYVVRGDSANAFSVPGGNIYVNEPLLRLAKNRDELAGVLAHETGHMVLHHVAKRIENQKKASTLAGIGSILGQIFLGPIFSMGSDYAMQNLYAGQDANLSRHVEAQADEEGARIMAATGVYNPWGMVWFFQTMVAEYGPGENSWLLDHPIFDSRIADLERVIRDDPKTFGKWDDTKKREIAYW